jgi:hypothetical protein
MKKLLLFILVLTALPLSASEQRTSIPLDNSPSLGPLNAPVTIVEFIDFQ